MKRNHAGQYSYPQKKSYSTNKQSYGSSNPNIYQGNSTGNAYATSASVYQGNNLNTSSPILPNAYSVPPPVITDASRLYFPHSPNRNQYTNIPPSVESPGASIQQIIRNGIVPVTHHASYYVSPRSPYPPRIPWNPSISPLSQIDTSTPPPPSPRRWASPAPLLLNNTYTPRPSPPARKKQRKKTIAENVPSREIKIEDAEAALKCEMEHTFTTKQLMIRFPDPPIDRDTVLKFNPCIKKVHFQQPSTPRYCFIQLDEEADSEKVIEELRQIDFGLGKLRVELKHDATRRPKAEDIDPYVLFVGNISQHTPAETIKNLFHPGRVDIGPSQKIKNSRYALVKFFSAQDAIEVFKKTQGVMVGDHSLNVRFRRLNGSVGFPGDKPPVKKSVTPQSNQGDDPKEEARRTASHKVADPVEKSTAQMNDVDPTIRDVSDLPPVKKEEDYYYYEEHPEPADELDIKLKNEYYDENAELYMEHPEYDYDYDYYYESEFEQNSFTPAAPNSQAGASTSSQTLDKRKYLGHAVKQIHIPPPPTNSPPPIPPPPPGPSPSPPPAPHRRPADVPHNLDEIRVKSELENDEFEGRGFENESTMDFLKGLQVIKETLPASHNNCTAGSTGSSEMQLIVPKVECDNDGYEDSNRGGGVVQGGNGRNMDLLVRIPRDKIQINALAAINNRSDKHGKAHVSYANNG